MRINTLLPKIFVSIASFFYGCNYSIAHDNHSDSISSVIVLETILRNLMIQSVEEENGTVHKHIVDRGETWTLLAQQSGSEEWELMALNPEFSELLTGMEIRLPDYPKFSQRYENKISSIAATEFEEAEKFMKANQWNKSKKIYDKILKKNESLTAYYLRGISNYNDEKFKEAEADFGVVVRNDKFNLFEKASTLRWQASEAWEAKKQARAELLGNILQTTLQVGAEVANAYYQNKMMQTPSNSFPSSSAASPTGVSIYSPAYAYSGEVAQKLSNPGYIQQQFQQIAQATMMQVQQQELAEYQQFRQFYLNMGKDITIDEYRILKGQAIAEAKYGSSTTFSNESTFSNTTTTNSGSSTSTGRKCVYCNGTGRVVKEQSVATFGLNDPQVKCEECGGYFPRSWCHRHYDCTHCHNGIAK